MDISPPKKLLDKQLLQNNDIYLPFELEGESFILTLNINETRPFILLTGEGYRLDSADFGLEINHAKKILKKKNTFYVGNGIASIFCEEKNKDDRALELRNKIFKLIDAIDVNDNYAY